MLWWKLTGEGNSPPVRNLKPSRSKGHVIANERWIHCPNEPSVSFPGEGFTPKIQMEYERGPRRLVKNVETERRRRLYASFDLTELLMQRGICLSDISCSDYLPLEIFDDEEFDCRTPKEWLDLVTIDGKIYPLPAEALLRTSTTNKIPSSASSQKSNSTLLEGANFSENSDLRWERVAVMDYEADKKLWKTMTLDGEKRIYKLPRLLVRFLAEDPRIFVSRVEAALLERSNAKASIKYNMYLDNMPLEGIEPLNDVLIEALLIQVRPELKRQGSYESKIRTVVQELQRNHKKVLCDLECRRLLRNFFALPAEVREYARWNTLYVHPQVFEAMLVIVEECHKVSNMTLFTLKHGKPVTLQEFESQQLHVTHSVLTHLKERWIGNIMQAMRMCLRDIGKGWYDLKQKRHYVYDVMKLRRLIDLVKQWMQSAIRDLIETSTSLYFKFLEVSFMHDLEMDGNFEWKSDLRVTMLRPKTVPIFEVEINLAEDGAFYTTNPALFEEKLDFIYMNVLQLCQQIKQIHPELLKNLRFSNDLYLNSVGKLDDDLKMIDINRKKLKIACEKSIIPLQAYVKEYDKYLELYHQNTDKYAREFEEEEHSTLELRDEVLMQYALKTQLESEIPKRISIGVYNVNIEKLRSQLIEKRQSLGDSLLQMHTIRLKNQIEEINDEFRRMNLKLIDEPQSIEQVFEMREWMDGIPMIVTDFNEALQKLKLEYDLLDTFHWNLADEDFQLKWETLKYPLVIHTQMEETYQNLEFLEKETFYKAQKEDESTIAEKIDTLIGMVSNIASQTDVKKVKEISVDTKKTRSMMVETQEFGLLLNSRQKLFGKRVVPFESLSKLMKEFEPYESFWLTANDWLSSYEIWMNNPLAMVDGSKIETMVTEMNKTMTRCAKIFQDQSEVAALANDLKSQMETFKPYVGVIQALRNPGIKERHLEEISKQTGMEISMTSDLTFKDFLNVGIMQYGEIITEISESAAKEHAIEDALQKMKKDWEAIAMEVVPYKDTGTFIMKVADETQLLLDDHIMNTQQISFSPFKAAFEEDIDKWANKLKLAQTVIDLWIEVQKIWMYLEPIFSSEDISRQLPVEAKKYSTMERNWRRIMKQAHDNPIIIRICPDRTLLESLRECYGMLEIVQKGLSDYLESRRMLFPRFFFLSDDELLEILAQTRNVQAVQPHLKKCFESMKSLRFEDDLTITRMYSAENEEVIMEPSVIPRGSVESWLNDVEASMRSTLRSSIGRAVEKVEKIPRKEWVFMWPGQVSLCIGQAAWTKHVEKAISGGKLQDYMKVMISQLDDLRDLVRDPKSEIQRMMLEAIIIIEVHARDVLSTLIEGKVDSINDFDWISQLRYYWVDHETNGPHLKVRAVNAEFQYGYEYLGNNGRLVITPLTDRCYLTLTGALHLKFGGAPAGPAGTGKTETTKDLAKAFAIQCVVFNCSDQLDFMSMGKFFKGLA
ncbi:hypothetical protein QAD02_009576, partial [Eretmocerus hayati]